MAVRLKASNGEGVVKSLPLFALDTHSLPCTEKIPYFKINQIGNSDSNSLLPCPARHSASFDYSKQSAND